MTVKNLKNIAASVRQRLFNRSEIEQRPFIELLQYYAMERFLYRLSKSPHAHRFVLKGALMLKVWDSPMPRPTIDIDMLGITSNDENSIVAQIHDVLSIGDFSDGITFDPASIKTAKILEDADYEGINVMFKASLEAAKINVRIDIGFGDIVYPRPEKNTFPTLLDFPAPNLWCYSKESVIAEKFDAMVTRGITNSRMKDFYDVWLLSRLFNFELKELAEAVRLTFLQRKTDISNEIIAFTKGFKEAKQPQWIAFRNRMQVEHIPVSFQEVASAVELFLKPIVTEITSGISTPHKWGAPGPWV